VPGVEVVCCFFHAEDGDARGQLFVHLAQQAVSGGAALGTQMRNLFGGMDTGIGSAGAMEFHLAPERVFGGGAEFPHHCSRVFLFLPATVASAVVFDSEFPGQGTRLAEFGWCRGLKRNWALAAAEKRFLSLGINAVGRVGFVLRFFNLALLREIVRRDGSDIAQNPPVSGYHGMASMQSGW
jgi:hypothetical protein